MAGAKVLKPFALSFVALRPAAIGILPPVPFITSTFTCDAGCTAPNVVGVEGVGRVVDVGGVVVGNVGPGCSREATVVDEDGDAFANRSTPTTTTTASTSTPRTDGSRLRREV